MADTISAPMLSRRGLVFLGIVGLHIVFVWVLNEGLRNKVVETVFGPIETKMIEDVVDEEEKPPPPPPKIEAAPPPFVPPPDIAIDLPVETSTTTAITATTTKPVVKPPPAAPVAVNRVGAKQNPKRPAITQDDYPPQSKRLGEEGTTTVRMNVEANGSISQCEIAKSSGFPRLDETACKKLLRARFIAGTENGKPVAMWIEYRVVWKIEK